MKRHFAYITSVSVGILIFASPLHHLFRLSQESELYSHCLLIPLVSLFFLFIDRNAIFKNQCWQLIPGLILALAAIGVYALALYFKVMLNRNDFLSASIFAFVLWLNAMFIAMYGLQAFKTAIFPLSFLALMAPIPTAVLDPIIRFLQIWSANAVQLAYEIFGIPYLRVGTSFQLPGIAIEVAKECSGIRSSIALFMTVIIAGQMFLKTSWRKALLASTIIPLTIFKNAIRITTLSLLAVYVDHSWLTNSWLHKGGGIVFFVLALLCLVPILWILARSESEGRSKSFFHLWPNSVNRN